MKIKEINYSSTFQVKEYHPLTLSANADVMEGEDLVECYKKLATTCTEGYFECKREIIRIANEEAKPKAKTMSDAASTETLKHAKKEVFIK